MCDALTAQLFKMVCMMHTSCFQKYPMTDNRLPWERAASAMVSNRAAEVVFASHISGRWKAKSCREATRSARKPVCSSPGSCAFQGNL